MEIDIIDDTGNMMPDLKPRVQSLLKDVTKGLLHTLSVAH